MLQPKPYATTEVQKIPLTVLSRCQRYDLRRLSIEEILVLLKNIAQNENLKSLIQKCNSDINHQIVNLANCGDKEMLELNAMKDIDRENPASNICNKYCWEPFYKTIAREELFKLFRKELVVIIERTSGPSAVPTILENPGMKATGGRRKLFSRSSDRRIKKSKKARTAKRIRRTRKQRRQTNSK